MSNPKSNLSPREVPEAQNAISFLSKLVSSTEDRRKLNLHLCMVHTIIIIIL